jgi:hypothetical protein
MGTLSPDSVWDCSRVVGLARAFRDELGWASAAAAPSTGDVVAVGGVARGGVARGESMASEPAPRLLPLRTSGIVEVRWNSIQDDRQGDDEFRYDVKVTDDRIKQTSESREESALSGSVWARGKRCGSRGDPS